MCILCVLCPMWFKKNVCTLHHQIRMPETMKNTLYLLLAGLMIGIVSAAFVAPKKGHVRHIVVFKYKSSATLQQINEVTTAFRDLKDKIRSEEHTSELQSRENLVCR